MDKFMHQTVEYCFCRTLLFGMLLRRLVMKRDLLITFPHHQQHRATSHSVYCVSIEGVVGILFLFPGLNGRWRGRRAITRII